MLAGFVECFTVSRRDGIVTTSFDDHDMNAVGNMPVIFLVGMRGSGKTTLGRALADKLGCCLRIRMKCSVPVAAEP